MPPVAAGLAAIGGGSALAGAATVIGTGATIGAALSDNKNAKKAIDNQQQQVQKSQEFIEKMTKQGRHDAFKMFSSAQDSRQKGFQSSLDLFNQSVPAQANLFQRGNVAAQNTQIQGLPQIQNAILGRPTDLNFKPYSANLKDMPFKKPELAKVTPIEQPGAPAPAGLPPPGDYENMLRWMRMVY